MTGNKGEWSEIYALFKMIAEKEIYGGDQYLNQIENLLFPIIQILKQASNGTFIFSYDSDIVIVSHNNQEFKIPIIQFKEYAVLLLDEIKNNQERTFSVLQVEEFLNSFELGSIKAKSTEKSDIKIRIHDFRTGIQPLLGFSIKSYFGGAPTLLNASQSTNFIYEIEGCELSKTEIERINSISTKSKVRDRIDEIKKLGGRLKFLRLENSIFQNNLILVDSLLPQIIASCLEVYYSSSLSKSIDLLADTRNKNLVGYDLTNDHDFYNYKYKRFLTDVALGLQPSKVWSGQLDATGGYLVVKTDGDIVCYHIYNRNEFEEYLYRNTKLETPSTTRHNFGSLYLNNDNVICMNLNLQIRFV